MEKDFGLRFTDETYATKDDVKRALNISSIDSIWDKITQFRYTEKLSKILHDHIRDLFEMIKDTG